MRPAGLAVVITFRFWRKAPVGKFYRGFAVVFTQLKNLAGVGPFLFIVVPGHIAIGTQPNHLFTGNQFRYRVIEKGIAAHLNNKLIALLFSAAAKVYAP